MATSPDTYITPRTASESAAGSPAQAPDEAAGGPGREAAPGVARHDVRAVNAKDQRSLYADRIAIHPKRAHGTFRNLKWLVMGLTLGVYYITPWLRWDRGPALPDQAVLIDFEHQRLFFGPMEIWAQEFYYVTGLLILASLALFLVTALAGRVWCGYACPQTVWTDLFVMVERFVQGDRNARLRLQKSPWTADKIWKLGATHAIWLLIALVTGGAFIFYFRDAPTLAQELFNGTAPYVAYLFLGVFTFTTYTLGGLAREQVCIYMCPWPRIQGAMYDDHSLLVSYRAYRGEPRGAHKKDETWEGRGDCIDCKQCVVVCPVGIDIRDGPQLECIQCALCIDACNEIMDKIGRPRNLIAYDTFHNLKAAETGGSVPVKIFRPRTILYMVLLPAVLALMTYGWVNRSELQVNVLRDRNPLFVRLSDGGIRNGYTVKILNKRHDTRTYKLSIEGLPDGAAKPRIDIVGLESAAPGIAVAPDNLRALRVYLSLPAAAVSSLEGEAADLTFVVTDTADGSQTRRNTNFRRPQP
ncbi:MAG: cytochrome c oxidase accessory protein CcoG [Alphaproteobacteria bacterium]|nr:cytochrome c oxidase accessory protein CcoG [Alphaproteobacteria bacterium]